MTDGCLKCGNVLWVSITGFCAACGFRENPASPIYKHLVEKLGKKKEYTKPIVLTFEVRND